MEQSLVHSPVVVLLQLGDLLRVDGSNMLIQLVSADCVEKIINCSFDFNILRRKKISLKFSRLMLKLDELVLTVCPIVLGHLYKDHLADGLEVVLDTVLDDVVDTDDQLLQLAKTVVHVLEVSVNVH